MEEDTDLRKLQSEINLGPEVFKSRHHLTELVKRVITASLSIIGLFASVVLFLALKRKVKHFSLKKQSKEKERPNVHHKDSSKISGVTMSEEERKFLEKFGELKKWVEFERLPSSVLIKNEAERQELKSLLKEIIALGREFRKKERDKFFSYLREYQRYLFSASSPFERQEFINSDEVFDQKVLDGLIGEIKEACDKIRDPNVSLLESCCWNLILDLLRDEIWILYSIYFEKIPNELWGKGAQYDLYSHISFKRYKETGIRDKPGL